MDKETIAKIRRARVIRRAKLAGGLDIIGMLVCLVLLAGYIVCDLVAVEGLPAAVSDIWLKVEDFLFDVYGGKFGDWLFALTENPALPYAILHGVFAFLFLVMALGAFRQCNHSLKKGSCALSAVLSLLLLAAFGFLFAEHFIWKEVLAKWYLLVPCVYFFVQMCIKSAAYAKAY